MDSEILIAGLQLQNLSENAGFQQIAKPLPYRYVDSNGFPFNKSEFGTLKKRINLTLYEIYLKSITNKYKLIHYIFPELHLTFSQPSNKEIISVGTIHLPLDWATTSGTENALSPRQDFVRKSRKTSFERFDSLITVTKANINEIKSIFPKADVFYLPHGVHDNSKHLSNKQSKGNFVIIIVGSNFRDFALARQILEFASAHKPKWRFHFVGAGKSKTELAKYSNAIVYPFLNEVEYLKLLGSCDLHLLPLTFATANNAIVEAHSVGTPTLVTDLDSVKDYGISTTHYFHASLTSVIASLDYFDMLSIEQLASIKDETLVGARPFFWENIAKKLDNYYSQLLENRR